MSYICWPVRWVHEFFGYPLFASRRYVSLFIEKKTSQPLLDCCEVFSFYCLNLEAGIPLIQKPISQPFGMRIGIF